MIVTKSWWAYDGMLAVLDENDRVISLPGGSAPEFKNGIMEEPQYDDQTLMNPHDVCVDNEGNLYVPQWYSGKTYPVMFERV